MSDDGSHISLDWAKTSGWAGSTLATFFKLPKDRLSKHQKGVLYWSCPKSWGWWTAGSWCHFSSYLQTVISDDGAHISLDWAKTSGWTGSTLATSANSSPIPHSSHFWIVIVWYFTIVKWLKSRLTTACTEERTQRRMMQKYRLRKWAIENLIHNTLRGTKQLLWLIG